MLAKISAELRNRADVGSLGRRRYVQDRHVLDHAAAKRAQLGHPLLLSEGRPSTSTSSCAIDSQRMCWKAGPTFGISRSCSDITTGRRRRAIRRSPPIRSGRRRARWPSVLGGWAAGIDGRARAGHGPRWRFLPVHRSATQCRPRRRNWHRRPRAPGAIATVADDLWRRTWISFSLRLFSDHSSRYAARPDIRPCRFPDIDRHACVRGHSNSRTKGKPLLASEESRAAP
jgi:hypothetical protein